MQTTISLRVPEDLALKLKKTSKIRGISMSKLIQTALENIYTTSNQSKTEEPEIFKYFGIFDKDDEQINEFERDLEKRKSQYKLRKIDL